MNEINAKNSLCWTCKFGICVEETETERLFHENLREILDDDESNSLNLDIAFGSSESEQPPGLIEHTICHERVKAVCFWKPADLPSGPPILVANVRQCSRYETS
jgi:hypothetical protein